MNLSDIVPNRGVEAATNMFHVVRRRLWSKPGTLHLELPDLQEDEYRDFTATAHRELEAIDGVVWARANAALGRMIVAWDPAKTSREQILGVVDAIEDRYDFGPGDYDDDRPDHPGDDEQLVRAIARMAAALTGAGAGMASKILERRPGRRRFDLAALMAVVDNVPHIHDLVVNRLGRLNTESWMGLTNPIVQGLGSGPVGPTLEFIYQSGQFFEAVQRRRGWRRREPQLSSHPDRVDAAPRKSYRRPIPVPDGPIEEYSEEAWQMSLGGFLVGLADTQQLEQAVTPVLDALPKPGRYGRDAFCASLTGVLANRDMVVMDPAALRLLDRIDTVIIDGDLLVTDCYRLGRIATAPDVDDVRAYRRAEQLLDPLNPELIHSEDDWTLGPAADFDVDEDWVRQLRSRGARGDLLALAEDDEVRAIFSLRLVTDRASRAFVDTIHDHGLEVIIISDHFPTAQQFRPHRIKTPTETPRFIRHLQREEHVVAYFANGPSPGVEAADLSAGFTIRGDDVPWGTDVIAADRLEDATFLIEAIAEARRVSKNCAMLAGTGAGIGALSAIRGLAKTRPGRVMLAVNAASLLALGYGAWQARQLEQRLQPLPEAPQPWHRMRVDEVFDDLDANTEGLTDHQARQRHPDDDHRPGAGMRLTQAVGRELANPLTPLLAGGAAVSAIVGSMTDAAIVGTVIAFNGIAGGFERYKAEESIQRMARREVIEVQVRRDHAWTQLEADRLVPGDVIRLESGDVVPADCRIVDSEQLEVDESTLTGESLPVSKSGEPSFAPVASDRSSMLYEGTAVVAGEVTAVVVAVGEQTEMRRTRWAAPRRDVSEGVEARLQEFSDITLPFVGAAGAILMTLGVFRRRNLEEMVGPAVNLAVSAVPEGLPLLSTAAQLAASRRLSERNVIVQNPRAMEAVGRAQVICIDKTGTLTEGTLQLKSVYDGHTQADREDWTDSHRSVLRSALRATPESADDEPLPHATDQAIVDGAADAGIFTPDWESDTEIPFRTELAFHACLGRRKGRRRIAVKGSPEEVLKRCSGWRRDGKWARLSNKKRDELLDKAEQLAGQGLRLLAVAERKFQDGPDEDLAPEDVTGLTFYGFVGLADPVRPRARDAVESLYAAGIMPIMLTGDHPETARSIARQVGLKAGEMMTGDQVAQLEEDELAEALTRVNLIARMTPTHKVRIVEALQETGRAVAMTGDGGNDAAAIRLADAGIALGADAAPAAREAADLVVSDSRIETIVDAIVEGRGMWRSVRDAVSILIGGNLGEILFMLASGLVRSLPALNARQLLLVNLFTDVAPALAIALRSPPEVSPEQLLHEGPEESLGESLRRDIGWRAALTGSSAFLAWYIARHTFQKKRASTIGLVTVVCSQLGQTLTTAKPDPAVWAAALGSAAGLLALIETPVISHALGSRPLGPVGLTTAFGASALASVASLIIPRLPEIKKAIQERLPTGEEPTHQDFLDEFYRVMSEAGLEKNRDL